MDTGTIAVVKPCCIGDCVMALPALAVLRETNPRATIDVFVGAHSAQIFEGQPSINNVHRIPDQPTPASSARLVLTLRGYDAVMILDRSRYLKAAMRMSGAGARAAVTPQRPETRHESNVYLDVVREVGTPIQPEPPVPTLFPLPDAQGRALQLVEESCAPYVVLHPGGASNPGTQMFEKRWPVDRYRELARAFIAVGLHVVLSGGPGDSEVVDMVRQGVSGATSLAGRADLRTTAEVIRKASLYVGGDTGMSHVAAAVGTPVVAIFGPTNPRRYRPLGERVIVLAPEASWEIEDQDLRSRDYSITLPSTSEIPIRHALTACKQLLDNRVRL